jgi:SAM-dependent methyltransferase
MPDFTLRSTAPVEFLRRTKTRFAELGFSQAELERRLGLGSLDQLSETERVRAEKVFPLETPQDFLSALFIFGQAVSCKKLSDSLGQGQLDFLVQSGLVSELRRGILRANVLLLPFRSLIIASDRDDYRQPDEVWTPSVQTFATEKFLPKEANHALDMATGSGILALLMSRCSKTVQGIDINPRAIEFARFNAWFNERPNVSFEAISCGDFTRKSMDRFDLITGVFPDLMVGTARRQGFVSRVAPDGMILLKEIYTNLDRLLEPGGVCFFWHGITASSQTIPDFFEEQIIKSGNLARGFEVIALSAIKGGQETGTFLVRKESPESPPLFSRLSATLGLTDAPELFEVTNARRRFQALLPRERQKIVLRVTNGLLLKAEHRFQDGRLLNLHCQIGRYRFSRDVFELLQLIDGSRTFNEITNLFLRNKLGDEAVVESEDRQKVERTIYELVDKGIIGAAEA